MAWIFGIAALSLALLERSRHLRFRPSRLLRRGFGTDAVYLLTGYVAGASLAAAYVAAASGWLGEVTGLQRMDALDLPLAVSVPAAVVLLDLGNYLAHDLLHRFGPLWELHKVHHSSPTLDWLATFRSHLLEQTLRRVVAPLLLVVAGFPIEAVALASAFFIAWAMLNHSNLAIDLRAIEGVFVTPRLHRLHHVPKTTARNLGTVFSIWDRWFGRLVVADTLPTTAFGIPGEVVTYPQRWLAQLVEPARRTARSRGAGAEIDERLAS